MNNGSKHVSVGNNDMNVASSHVNIASNDMSVASSHVNVASNDMNVASNDMSEHCYTLRNAATLCGTLLHFAERR